MSAPFEHYIKRHADLLLTLLALPWLALDWHQPSSSQHHLTTLLSLVALANALMRTSALVAQTPGLPSPLATPLSLAARLSALAALAALAMMFASFLMPSHLVSYDQWQALFAVWPGDLPFHSARPSILITLALICLALLPLCQRSLGIVAPVVIATGVLLTLAHLVEQHGFGFIHEASPSGHALLAIVCLFGAEVCVQWPRRGLNATGVALLVSLLVMLVVLVIWHYHNAQNIRQINQTARLRIDDLSELLSHEILVSDQAMSRFATGWDSAGATPDTRVWAHRAQRYARDFDYLHAIAFIERKGPRVTRVYPHAGNQPLQGLSTLTPESSEPLWNALSGHADATGLTPLAGGGRGMVFYLPVFDPDSQRVPGATAFVVKPARLFERLFRSVDNPDFLFRVSHDDETFYASTTEAALSRLDHCNVLRLGQSRFTLCATASYARLFAEGSRMPAIVLSAGLTFAWLLYLLMHCYQRLRNEHRSVKRANRRLRTEVEKRIALQHEVEWMARHDELTELPNRRYFSAWCNELGTEAPRAIIIADVDHFKQINDRLGHPVGDEYLQRIARAIREPVEAHGGLLARFGGEEFIACLPGFSPAQAWRLGESLRQRIEALTHGEGTWPATLSLGATTSEGAAVSLDELVRSADRALYRAKAAGRNRLEFAFPEEAASSGERTGR